MRVLITGAGGQVGREFSEFCSASGDDVIALDHAALDITDRDAVLRRIGEARPSIIVHAASWTAVDACEGDPARAHEVNAVGTGNVVAGARSVDARVIYLSTDYVFDGTKDTPYVESDAPNPQSAYGRSKWEGEQLLDLDVDTIVRISWVCGRYGSNMVKRLMRLAASDTSPAFVDDQRGHPTIVVDLVPTLRRLATGEWSGVFHVTNQGAVSWFEFARDVFALAGHDPDRVRAITTAELVPARPAQRPANSVLENAALLREGLPLLPHYSESLRSLIHQLQANGDA